MALQYPETRVTSDSTNRLRWLPEPAPADLSPWLTLQLSLQGPPPPCVPKPKKTVQQDVSQKDLQAVVEANTLLSGLGVQ
jgi:hypothetical protein